MSLRKTSLVGAVLLLGAAGTVLFMTRPVSAPKQDTPSRQTDTAQTTAQQKAPDATKTKQPAPQPYDDPASITYVVNKQRALAADFVPKNLTSVQGIQLTKTAADALEKLIADASKQGVQLTTISGYRSYAQQRSVYNGYVAQDGQAAADTYSARPGHSEHQTGLAADLGASGGNCDLQICFAQTSAGTWLAQHAYNYGFIIRYPNGKTSLTGYQYEPWHIRYVGTDIASSIQQSGKTLEQYFGLPAAPGY